MHEKTDELLKQIKSHSPLSKWERESIYEKMLTEFICHSNDWVEAATRWRKPNER